MPRRHEITARAEREYLEGVFSAARFALLTTEFRPHRRQDVPGRTCPCCGSEVAVEIGREDDLEVLVDLWRQKRRNAWEVMTAEGRERFEDLAGQAVEYGTEGANVVHIPIVYTCTEDAVAQIRDDSNETIYWSGGWRSGKTFRMDQWWTRGWVRYGGQGILFWLIGPERKHAFRMMQKIFLGRAGADKRRATPSILPKYEDAEGKPRSMVAPHLPPSFKVPDPAFELIDGSRVELYHTKTVAALEGEDVQRIAMDEVTRMTSADAYKICRGRVTQCGGQVGLASVPDDLGPWVYDEIVAPCEAGTAEHKVVHTVSSYDNVWLPLENAKRLEEGETDPVVRDQKVRGIWTRHGMYAYSDAFAAAEIVLEVLAHDHDGWGFEYDVTREVAREIFGKPADYLGALDFNERPQTALIAKVFARNRRDWETWHLVWVREQVLQRADARQAAGALRDLDGGLYQGAGLVADCNGFWDGHRYGGRPSKSSDVYEFASRGFMCAAPVITPRKRAKGGKVAGGEPQNPGVPESRRLVRQLLAERRMLVAAGGAPLLANALPKVPQGRKPRSAAGTALDRQIYNLDDAIRYLAWKIFGARMVPGRQRKKPRVRGAPRLATGA